MKQYKKLIKQRNESGIYFKSSLMYEMKLRLSRLNSTTLCSLMKFSALVIFLLPFSARAQEVIEQGTCGENLIWVLTSDSVLTISGSGMMNNFDRAETPWFSNRTKIKTVNINDAVATIGDEAFCYCVNLISVEIPNSVTEIGEYAFCGCSSLTSIEISNWVTEIKNLAFIYCYNLTSINIGNNNPNYSSNDGVLYSKSQDILICYC